MKKTGLFILFWMVLFSLCFADSSQETEPISIMELPHDAIKVTFTPSPDPRAAGHNFYVFNMHTKTGVKHDLKKEVVKNLAKEDLEENIIYKLTATAYGIVNNKPAESVHSDALYVKLVRPVPEKPHPPQIIDIRWQP